MEEEFIETGIENKINPSQRICFSNYLLLYNIWCIEGYTYILIMYINNLNGCINI